MFPDVPGVHVDKERNVLRLPLSMMSRLRVFSLVETKKNAVQKK